jgi:hypothetical protein
MAKTSKATRKAVQPTEPLYRFGEYREEVKKGIGRFDAENRPDTEKLCMLAGRAFFDCVYFIPEDQIKIGIMSPVADMEFIKKTVHLETVWRAAKQYHAKAKWPQAGPVEFLDLSERSAMECALRFTDYFVNSILEQRTMALGVFMHGEPQGNPKQKDYDKWIALTYRALSHSIPERCLDTFIRDAKSLWIKIEQEYEIIKADPAIQSKDQNIPLTDEARLLWEKLQTLQRGQCMPAKEIVIWFLKEHRIQTNDRQVGRWIKELEPLGADCSPQKGYYLKYLPSK